MFESPRRARAKGKASIITGKNTRLWIQAFTQLAVFVFSAILRPEL
jgi:hypothetical protein